jgi:hypothetical protein
MPNSREFIYTPQDNLIIITITFIIFLTNLLFKLKTNNNITFTQCINFRGKFFINFFL